MKLIRFGSHTLYRKTSIKPRSILSLAVRSLNVRLTSIVRSLGGARHA